MPALVLIGAQWGDEGKGKATDQLGASVDFVVNNAGLMRVGPAAEASPDDWDQMLAVNLRGAFIVAQEALPAMRLRKWGRIINITSIGGLMVVVFLAALVGGWIAAGGPRISYVGFQLAFAFFLCVIQGAAPAFDKAANAAASGGSRCSSSSTRRACTDRAPCSASG